MTSIGKKKGEKRRFEDDTLSETTQQPLKNEKKRKKEKKKDKKSKKSKKIKTLEGKLEPVEETIDIAEVKNFLKDEPKYSYLNIIQIEHAATKFIEMYKKILDISPTLGSYQNLVKNKAKLDLDIVPSLSRYMLRLAAEVKTLYILKKDPVLQKLPNFEENFDPNNNDNPILPGILNNDVQLLINLLDEDDSQDVKESSNVNKKEKVFTKNESLSWPPPIPEIRNPTIRARVFTHKSLVKNKNFLSENAKLNSHNEMLEFLGDAALYFAVTRIIYKKFPYFDDGQLTELRIQLVNNERLKKFSLAYGLRDKLKCGPGLLNDDTYKHGKRKLEADVFEAYIGGLVEDNPTNYAELIENWLEKLMEPTIKELTATNIKLQSPETTNLNAKRQLYSLIGYAALGLSYRVIKRRTPDDPSFVVECRIADGTVLGIGRGKNVKIAGSKAAESVLANKALVEEYANKRAAIPRSQTIISLNKSNKVVNSPKDTGKNSVGLTKSNDKQIVMGEAGELILK